MIFVVGSNINFCIPQDNQPPELKDRGRKQNRPPVIQEEVVSDLLSPLGTYKFMGLDGIPPSLLRELAERARKAALRHLSSVLATQEGRLEVGQCGLPQEGLEEGAGELQAW